MRGSTNPIITKTRALKQKGIEVETVVDDDEEDRIANNVDEDAKDTCFGGSLGSFRGAMK